MLGLKPVDVPPSEDDIQDASGNSDQSDVDPEILRLVRTCHRNLGHPGQESFLRLLRDAGADQKIIDVAKTFTCRECLLRGRRSPTRPAVVPRHYEKWQCVSVDTFWWKTPKEVLKEGQQPEHILGLSMMDEATDFHCAVIVKTSLNGAPSNISGEEFRQAFSKGWLQHLPAPSLLRYDGEGFLRKLEVKNWLENFGLKLEPVASESGWQVGKHSKHLQTLKDQMSLLAVELQSDTTVEELLSLAVSAKNNMHNIRGYSPNQWAFGQNHSRIASFLQQYRNLPLQSSREDDSLENQLQKEHEAQKLFLKVDASRRMSTALNHRCRPLREFVTGDLV